jgi:two-component system, OmpR family, sensor histidine kinase VicK
MGSTMNVHDQISIELIKEIGNLTSDGWALYDIRKNEMFFWNDAFLTILEVTPERLSRPDLSLLTEVFIDDETYIDELTQRLTTDLRLSDVELRIASRDEKYVLCSAVLLAERGLVSIAVKDVSKWKEHSNYIIEFGARKNTILDMVTHNLSGPLNITNNLLDRVDQFQKPEDYRHVGTYSRLIRENIQQCIEIINSFLREEHFTSPQIFVKRNRFDAISKIEILLKRYKQFAPEKNIRLVAKTRELFVTGDDVKFFQIVNNLISNAIKFTPDDGKIKIDVREEEAIFQVTIEDNGIGIPEYLKPHLFLKNSPAGRSGLRGEKSIGMGLYIVAKLVHLMKGTILFDSTEGKGSTFTLRFPKD